VGAFGCPTGSSGVVMPCWQSLPWVAPGRGLVWLSSAIAAITSPSFISSVGIQQAHGLDPAWSRIWFLDAAAHPVRSCLLVPVSSAEQRALELQEQCGAESLWIL